MKIHGRSQRGARGLPPPPNYWPLLGLGNIGLLPQLGLGFILSFHDQDFLNRNSKNCIKNSLAFGGFAGSPPDYYINMYETMNSVHCTVYSQTYTHSRTSVLYVYVTYVVFTAGMHTGVRCILRSDVRQGSPIEFCKGPNIWPVTYAKGQCTCSVFKIVRN